MMQYFTNWCPYGTYANASKNMSSNLNRRNFKTIIHISALVLFCFSVSFPCVNGRSLHNHRASFVTKPSIHINKAVLKRGPSLLRSGRKATLGFYPSISIVSAFKQFTRNLSQSRTHKVSKSFDSIHFNSGIFISIRGGQSYGDLPPHQNEGNMNNLPQAPPPVPEQQNYINTNVNTNLPSEIPPPGTSNYNDATTINSDGQVAPDAPYHSEVAGPDQFRKRLAQGNPYAQYSPSSHHPEPQYHRQQYESVQQNVEGNYEKRQATSQSENTYNQKQYYSTTPHPFSLSEEMANVHAKDSDSTHKLHQAAGSNRQDMSPNHMDRNKFPQPPPQPISSYAQPMQQKQYNQPPPPHPHPISSHAQPIQQKQYNQPPPQPPAPFIPSKNDMIECPPPAHNHIIPNADYPNYQHSHDPSIAQQYSSKSGYPPPPPQPPQQRVMTDSNQKVRHSDQANFPPPPPPTTIQQHQELVPPKSPPHLPPQHESIYDSISLEAVPPPTIQQHQELVPPKSPPQHEPIDDSISLEVVPPPPPPPMMKSQQDNDFAIMKEKATGEESESKSEIEVAVVTDGAGEIEVQNSKNESVAESNSPNQDQEEAMNNFSDEENDKRPREEKSISLSSSMEGDKSTKTANVIEEHHEKTINQIDIENDESARDLFTSVSGAIAPALEIPIIDPLEEETESYVDEVTHHEDAVLDENPQKAVYREDMQDEDQMENLLEIEKIVEEYDELENSYEIEDGILDILIEPRQRSTPFLDLVASGEDSPNFDIDDENFESLLTKLSSQYDNDIMKYIPENDSIEPIDGKEEERFENVDAEIVSDTDESSGDESFEKELAYMLNNDESSDFNMQYEGSDDVEILLTKDMTSDEYAVENTDDDYVTLDKAEATSDDEDTLDEYEADTESFEEDESINLNKEISFDDYNENGTYHDNIKSNFEINAASGDYLNELEFTEEVDHKIEEILMKDISNQVLLEEEEEYEIEESDAMGDSSITIVKDYANNLSENEVPLSADIEHETLMEASEEIEFSNDEDYSSLEDDELEALKFVSLFNDSDDITDTEYDEYLDDNESHQNLEIDITDSGQSEYDFENVEINKIDAMTPVKDNYEQDSYDDEDLDQVDYQILDECNVLQDTDSDDQISDDLTDDVFSAFESSNEDILNEIALGENDLILEEDQTYDECTEDEVFDLGESAIGDEVIIPILKDTDDHSHKETLQNPAPPPPPPLSNDNKSYEHESMKSVTALAQQGNECNPYNPQHFEISNNDRRWVGNGPQPPPASYGVDLQRPYENFDVSANQKEQTEESNMRIQRQTVIHEQNNGMWGITRRTSISYHDNGPNFSYNNYHDEQGLPPPPPPPP